MFRQWFAQGVAFSVVIISSLCPAQTTTESDSQSLLSAFSSYTDLRVKSVEQSLEILAATTEAKSGDWEKMKDLLAVYQRTDDGLVVWYARPDGTYYTVEKGLMDIKLSDREYFPDMMSGKRILGSLVVSKSTGQRSAVIAVPVEENDKVVGAIGASLFLDKLAEKISSILSLQKDRVFYALAPDGRTTLHMKTDRHFVDPREVGSETLKNAANEMLSKESGEVTYEFENVQKTAIFRTSPLTQWRFVLVKNLE